MTFDNKLRALVAGMRYAADKCDEYAAEATDYVLRERDLARARAMRSDANALEALINERDWSNGGAGERRGNAE